MAETTKDRLIVTAARLFKTHGFNGVGLNEILSEAKAPKGSLYHHFPNGKSDLALAAASWASDGMVQIIDDAYKEAADFAEGTTTLCHKLAKFFDLSGGWDGCPVSSILLDGPDNDLFRDYVNDTYTRWSGRVALHAERLGMDPDKARTQAETLMIGIQGAWTIARAQRSSDILRSLPARLLQKS